MERFRYFLYQNRRWLTPLAFVLLDALAVFCLIYLYSSRFASPTLTLFFSVAAFLLLLLLFAAAFRKKYLCQLRGAAAFAALFAFAVSFGAELYGKGVIRWNDLRLWLSVPALGAVFTALFSLFFRIFDRINARKQPKRLGFLSKIFYHRRIFFILWGFILLSWIPLFLAGFPGFFSYDAAIQWNQYVSGAVTNHHPALHTWLLGGSLELLAPLLGGYNRAIAAYLLLQMTAVSAVFSYSLLWMKRRGARPFAVALGALYFALSPVVAAYAGCSTKDTLFSAAGLLFLLFSVSLAENPGAFFQKPLHVARYAALALLMLMLRNNAVYALVLFALAALFLLKKGRWKTAALHGGILLTYAAYLFVLTHLLHVPLSGKQESLSVPIQQLARVYHYNRESLSGEEMETLFSYLPEPALENYNPKLSDPVKSYFNNALYSESPGDFFRFWGKIGGRNAGIYLDSLLWNTVDQWYIYGRLDGYGEPSYFWMEVETPGELHSMLPGLYERYYTLFREAAFLKFPVVRMLFSPAFMTWAMLLALGYVLYRGRGQKSPLLPLLYLLLLVLSLLPGPIVQIRYTLLLFFAFPFVCGCFAESKIYAAGEDPAAS